MVYKNPKNVLLIILDGWGIYDKTQGNAIALADTPFYDYLVKNHPFMTLQASGEAVGLPKGQIGTSEVNHLTIGAGRILLQSLVRINQSIDNGKFFKKQAFLNALKHAKNNRSSLHLIGLYSFGGVHSYANHLKSLVELAKQKNIKKLYLHLFSDGRDVSPMQGKKDFLEFENWLKKIGVGRIATISGRYFGMDRDENWGRTNETFHCLTQKSNNKFAGISLLFDYYYKQSITDEFIKPSFVKTSTFAKSSMDKSKSKSSGNVRDNDAIIFFNFRADRMRQLVSLFLASKLKNLHIVTMTRYKKEFNVNIAFPTTHIKNHLSEVLSKHKILHHHVSETEKYAHVTYFFNGRREKPYVYEKRTNIKSYSDIPTHDLRPKMRAPEITIAVKEILKRETRGFIVVNYANVDIVGHTANMSAVIKACTTIDKSLKQIVTFALEKNWAVLITSDHGNAEMLHDPKTGGPHTAHTLNPVPLILASNKKYTFVKPDGKLSDIAPTILKLMNIKKPHEMTGTSLI